MELRLEATELEEDFELVVVVEVVVIVGMVRREPPPPPVVAVEVPVVRIVGVMAEEVDGA
jgi:hypothetical protein